MGWLLDAGHAVLEKRSAISDRNNVSMTSRDCLLYAFGGHFIFVTCLRRAIQCKKEK